jgi:hypothetical protein
VESADAAPTQTSILEFKRLEKLRLDLNAEWTKIRATSR